MDTGARRRAAIVAGHTADFPAIDAALRDPDDSVRAAAVGAAVRAGRADEAIVRAAMSDPSAEVRRRGAVAAVAIGGSEVLVAALDDADQVVAETAAFALGELEDHPPGTTDALIRIATEHDEHQVREAAVAALGAIGDPAGLPTVIAAMGERATIRRRAVLALAAFDDPAADAALEAALGDRDRQVRQAAEDLRTDRLG